MNGIDTVKLTEEVREFITLRLPVLKQAYGEYVVCSRCGQEVPESLSDINNGKRCACSFDVPQMPFYLYWLTKICSVVAREQEDHEAFMDSLAERSLPEISKVDQQVVDSIVSCYDDGMI